MYVPASTPLAAAIAYALVASGSYLLVGHRVRVRPVASTRLLGAAVAGLVAVAVTLAVGVEGATADWLRTVLPGFAPDVYATAAALLVHVGPVPACAYAAYAGGGGRLRRFAFGYGALAGPALAVLAVTPLLPSAWWLVGVVAAFGIGLAAGTPLIVRWFLPTREPGATERFLREAAGGFPVRVVDAGTHANAMAAGVLPGFRTVFVSEALLARLPHEECAAVVAHEVGHHRRGHVPLRLGAAGAVVLPWLGATAAGVPGAFEVGAVVAALAVPVLFRLMRWTEHDADAYAAARTDGAALVRGLSRLTVEAPAPRSRLARVLALHPTLDERADRLR